jgi:putative membrane protein
MLIWLVLIAIVIAAALWFMRSGAGRQQQLERRPPGLDVLEERYARGEINREEYLQKKRDLTG